MITEAEVIAAAKAIEPGIWGDAGDDVCTCYDCQRQRLNARAAALDQARIVLEAAAEARRHLIKLER